MTRLNVPAVDDDIDYPSSDGQPMAETETHLLLMMALFPMLRRNFRDRPDVYVIANMLMYYRQGRPDLCRSPDIMVVKGIDGRLERRSYKTWVEGAAPCFVLELTSKKTAKEDQKDKRQLYQELGVREYFLFDPLDEYLPQPLMGYRLVDGQYEAIELESDGSLVSEELGLRFVPEGKNLAVFDCDTGVRLLSSDELAENLDDSRLDAELAKQQAKRSLKRAKAAQQRADAAEAELAALRTELERLRKPDEKP